MLRVLILDMSSETYSLKLTPKVRFLSNFSWQILIYLLSSWKNIFSYLVFSEMSNLAFASLKKKNYDVCNKTKQYRLFW